MAVTRSVGINKQNRPQQNIPKTRQNRPGPQNCIADWTDQGDINIFLKIEVTVNKVGKEI